MKALVAAMVLLGFMGIKGYAQESTPETGAPAAAMNNGGGEDREPAKAHHKKSKKKKHHKKHKANQ